MENYVNRKPYDEIPLIVLIKGFHKESGDIGGIYDFETPEAFVEAIQLKDFKTIQLNNSTERERQYYWKSLEIPYTNTEILPNETEVRPVQLYHHVYFRDRERTVRHEGRHWTDNNPINKVYDDWKDRQPPAEKPASIPTAEDMKAYRKQWREGKATLKEEIKFDNAFHSDESLMAKYKEDRDKLEERQEQVKKNMFAISRNFMLHDTEHMKKQVNNWVNDNMFHCWGNSGKKWLSRTERDLTPSVV